MYEFYIYDASVPDEKGKQLRLTVAYAPYRSLNQQSLVDSLRQHFDAVMPPDAVLLLGTEANEQAFQEVMHAESVKERLPTITRYTYPPAVAALCFGSDGRFRQHTMDGASLISDKAYGLILRTGLLNIFRLRHGILESGGAYHYVKPSGAHSDRFIRTGNVLVRGAEVSFVAFCLLPIIPPTITRIYTDTAGIDTVAHALTVLKQQLDRNFDPCPITSFSSYGGLDNFMFERPDTCLVLISASTSGHLQRILSEKKGIPTSALVTLFYLGNKTMPGILCDITRRNSRDVHCFDPVQNYPDSLSCEYCRRGSTPIRISGDQFLPESIKIDSRMILAEDAPKWLRGFCLDFVGRHLIKCHYGAASATDRPREIFVDIRSCLRREPTGVSPAMAIVRRLDRTIEQSVAATVSRIIHLADDASEALARYVASALNDCAGVKREIEISNAAEIQQNLDAHVRTTGSTLVIAACAVSGRRLLAVSQALRRIQKNHLIQYLLLLARTPDEDQLRYIRNDLRFGEYGPDDYDFRCVQSIHLPDDSPSRYSPWEEEVRLLKAARARRGNAAPEEAIESRIQFLESADSLGGLENEIFLPSCKEEQLALRPNFAFWQFDYLDRLPDVSQADVYMTTAAVLHAKRRGKSGDPREKWVQHEHSRIVISPRCFDRFNDGVIQAALLRAAQPGELDYSSDVQLSRAMQDILAFTFTNRTADAGEATQEFLMALASDKLRLQNEHLREVLEFGDSDLPPIGRFLRDYIRTRI